MMYSTRNSQGKRSFPCPPDQRFGSRVCVSAHRTRHRLERRRSTLSPRLKTTNVKVVSASCFCGCFPCKFAVAHSTLRRHFRGWWEEVRLFRMSPTHRVLLVLGALALRSIFGHLRTPLVCRRNSTWGTLGRILRMNPTRRTPESTLVFTRCTSTCHTRTR